MAACVNISQPNERQGASTVGLLHVHTHTHKHTDTDTSECSLVLVFCVFSASPPPHNRHTHTHTQPEKEVSLTKPVAAISSGGIRREVFTCEDCVYGSGARIQLIQLATRAAVSHRRPRRAG